MQKGDALAATFFVQIRKLQIRSDQLYESAYKHIKNMFILRLQRQSMINGTRETEGLRQSTFAMDETHVLGYWDQCCCLDENKIISKKCYLFHGTEMGGLAYDSSRQSTYTKYYNIPYYIQFE